MLGDNALNPKSGNGTLIPGKDIIYPSSFDLQTMQSDIALALLVSPVNFSPLIQPVCLPGKPFQVENRTSCWVTGWSLQDENGESGWWHAEFGQPAALGVVCKDRGEFLAENTLTAEYIATVLGSLFLCQDLGSWVTGVMVSVKVRFRLG